MQLAAEGSMFTRQAKVSALKQSVLEFILPACPVTLLTQVVFETGSS